MANDAYIAALQALQAADSARPEDRFNNIPVTVKSTLFFNASSAIAAGQFFSQQMGSQWQTANFPSTSQAYKFTHAAISTNIQFTPSNVLRADQYLRTFLEGSQIQITTEGNEVMNLWLYDLAPERVDDLSNVAGATASYVTISKKFNNTYALGKPYVVGAGETTNVQFVPADGLTTNAYTANVAPVITGNAPGLTTAGQGFYLSLYLYGVKAKINKG
jgi:hypothetical protein